MGDSGFNTLPALVIIAGGITGAALGDIELITDVLAGAGLGALAGNLMIIWRTRQGLQGREAQIIAAWSATFAVFAALRYAVARVL